MKRPTILSHYRGNSFVVGSFVLLDLLLVLESCRKLIEVIDHCKFHILGLNTLLTYWNASVDGGDGG